MQSSRVASGATDEPCARNSLVDSFIRNGTIQHTPSPDRAGNYASTDYAGLDRD